MAVVWDQPEIVFREGVRPELNGEATLLSLLMEMAPWAINTIIARQKACRTAIGKAVFHFF